jgi:hypothetical protein
MWKGLSPFLDKFISFLIVEEHFPRSEWNSFDSSKRRRRMIEMFPPRKLGTERGLPSMRFGRKWLEVSRWKKSHH